MYIRAVCVLIGYLLGCLSPASAVAWIKKKDLRSSGSRNLGATNTMLVVGVSYGALVMVVDILKAFAAVIIAEKLFPAQPLAGLIAGASAVVGHIFPFYLRFNGGKGLAAFGGMILGVYPIAFPILLVIATALMFIVNYGIAMPVSACILFPVMYAVHSKSAVSAVIGAAVSVLVFVKNIGGIKQAARGESPKVREYVREKLFGK